MKEEQNPKITIAEKNILYADEPLVGHCTNTRNTMNSGVAKALRDRFPEIYQSDRAAYLIHGKELLGRCEIVEVVTDKADTNIKFVANLYGQPNYGYDGSRFVDYEALYQSLERLKNYSRDAMINQIALPYKLASDRAGGHWPIVLEMIKHIFHNTGIEITLYKI
jgi:O-acetyl-ADP-ribose deacetylase (regulator of RNase III)